MTRAKPAKDGSSDEVARRYAVFASDSEINGGRLEGRFDRYDEVMGHCWKWDRIYLVQVDDDIMPLAEFVRQHCPSQKT
jgi:hypothetical protein